MLVTAALTVVLYRLALEGWINDLLPDSLARAMGWIFAASVIVLAIGAAASDMRKFDETRDRLR
jgi:hypothetical protein